MSRSDLELDPEADRVAVLDVGHALAVGVLEPGVEQAHAVARCVGG